MNLDIEIEKIVNINGANLYDIEIIEDGENKIFRVYITKDNGISLDLCASISRELSPFLDVYPPMSSKYTLEVSSPGIERKLTKLSHFKSSIGEKIKTKIYGKGKVKGILKSVDGDGFEIEYKDGTIDKLKYDSVGTTKTYYEWI
jgi:ribosome maturation factor RimP